MKTFSQFMEDIGTGNYETYVKERKKRKTNIPFPIQGYKEKKLAYMLQRDLPPN
jgi:hypothetical protein